MTDKITSLESLRQTIGGYRAARIIQVAGKLRLFDSLKQDGTAEDVAAEKALSVRGTSILLDALTALGLLEKDSENRYRNTSLAGEYLITGSPIKLLNSIDHSEQIYRRWALMEQSVKTGTAVKHDMPKFSEDQNANRIFIRAMHAHGYRRGKQIAAALDITDVRTVVDIGGGAGSYLIALAEKDPDIQGILVDLKLTLNTANEIIREFGFEDRIELREMDIFSGNLPFAENADLVILSNIIHIESAETNIHMLKRIRRSLKDHGRLILQDFILDPTGTEPLDYALFSINMLVSTERGRSWKSADIRQWLDTAGFGSITEIHAGTDSNVWEIRCRP